MKQIKAKKSWTANKNYITNKIGLKFCVPGQN